MLAWYISHEFAQGESSYSAIRALVRYLGNILCLLVLICIYVCFSSQAWLSNLLCPRWRSKNAWSAEILFERHIGWWNFRTWNLKKSLSSSHERVALRPGNSAAGASVSSISRQLHRTRLELLQPFHAMCFNLFQAEGVEVKDEFRAAHDMGDETADQHYREKRCSRPKANTCRGMCGLGCWCWSWFCGDCCWHRGCYEHDICCNYGRLTSYCATPFRYGFTCSKFGGYPRC